MAHVKAKPGESFESMWKRFKRSVEKAGILSDLKKHEYYEKPSVKRKKKQAAARKTNCGGHRRFSLDPVQPIPASCLPPACWGVNEDSE